MLRFIHNAVVYSWFPSHGDFAWDVGLSSFLVLLIIHPLSCHPMEVYERIIPILYCDICSYNQQLHKLGYIHVIVEHHSFLFYPANSHMLGSGISDADSQSAQNNSDFVVWG